MKRWLCLGNRELGRKCGLEESKANGRGKDTTYRSDYARPRITVVLGKEDTYDWNASVPVLDRY